MNMLTARNRKTIAAAVTALAVFAVFGAGPARSEGDPARGAEIFQKCVSCHSVGNGASNGVGPQLNGVYNAPAASRSGFNYSRALNEAGRNGLVWTEENLDEYLTNPRRFLTGGRMAFAGLPDPQDRADLISFLKTYE